jgi:adenylate cyclase, class 2
MSFTNIEIKARTKNPVLIREILLEHHAEFKGTDDQTDTYFKVNTGRLKLRQGNIENNLIYYRRNDQAGPKQSDFRLTPVHNSEGLLQVLSEALDVLTVVKKKREIYFIDNVKFHIDELNGLGWFVEIEAGNIHSDVPVKKLNEQCNYYMNLLGIKEEDLVSDSYSDIKLAGAGERQ